MKQIDQFEAISRERPLTDDEATELARLVSREPHEPVYRKWTLVQSRELLAIARVRGGLKSYAETTGRTYASVQTQLTKLKRQRRQRGIAFVGRFFYDGEIEGG